MHSLGGCNPQASFASPGAINVIYKEERGRQAIANVPIGLFPATTMIFSLRRSAPKKEPVALFKQRGGGVTGHPCG